MTIRESLLFLLIHKTEKFQRNIGGLTFFAFLVLGVAGVSFDIPLLILPIGLNIAIFGLKLIATNFRVEFFDQRLRRYRENVSPILTFIMDFLGPIIDTFSNVFLLMVGLAAVGWASAPYVPNYTTISSVLILVVAVVAGALWAFLSLSGVWQKMHDVYTASLGDRHERVVLSKVAIYRVHALALSHLLVAGLIVYWIIAPK